MLMSGCCSSCTPRNSTVWDPSGCDLDQDKLKVVKEAQGITELRGGFYFKIELAFKVM